MRKQDNEETMTKIWIVEMFNGKEWTPTVGVGLCRDDARDKKRGWEKRNPDDHFRVRKYMRER